MSTLILFLGITGVSLVVLAFLYLAMIAPRMFHRPDMSPFCEYFYAHRGLHDNASEVPENSMTAFRRAVEAGYGIELDVQLSKDNIPVVFHDYTLDRMCGGPGKVADYTFEELQQFSLVCSKERIPKFEDVLNMVDGRVPLIVEYKIESTDLSVCPIADKLLSRYKGLYCIETFNPLGLLWYRRHRKAVVRGQLSNAFLREKEYSNPLHFFLQNLLLNFLGRPDFVAYNHIYPCTLSRRVCCEWFGAVSVGWTIRSQEELQRAKKHFELYIFEGFRPCR